MGEQTSRPHHPPPGLRKPASKLARATQERFPHPLAGHPATSPRRQQSQNRKARGPTRVLHQSLLRLVHARANGRSRAGSHTHQLACIPARPARATALLAFSLAIISRETQSLAHCPPPAPIHPAGPLGSRRLSTRRGLRFQICTPSPHTILSLCSVQPFPKAIPTNQPPTQQKARPELLTTGAFSRATFHPTQHRRPRQPGSLATRKHACARLLAGRFPFGPSRDPARLSLLAASRRALTSRVTHHAGLSTGSCEARPFRQNSAHSHKGQRLDKTMNTEPVQTSKEHQHQKLAPPLSDARLRMPPGTLSRTRQRITPSPQGGPAKI